MKKILFFLIPLLFASTILTSQETENIDQEVTDASPEYLQTIYEKALKEFQDGKYEESLRYIRHVIKSDMNNYKLRYLAAHDHWKLSHFEPATVHFQTVMYNKPEFPGTYIDFALMKIHERNYYYAEKILEGGIFQLNKFQVEIPAKLYNVYSRLELLKGFPQKALYYAQMAKAAFDQSGTGIKDKMEAMILEARSQLLLENFDKAELAAQWAISMRKNNVYGYNLLGYIYSAWSKKIAGQDPVKSKQLADLATENFNTALKTPELVDEFKTIIETNILNLK